MSETSIDELLAKAEGVSKKRLRSENNANAIRYIKEVGWTAGTVKVPTYIIFYHYRSVWKGDSSSKANKTVFFRTFNKQFPTYRSNGQRFYLLNEGVIEITKELKEIAKSYDKQHWQKKAKTDRKKAVQPFRQTGDETDAP